MSERDRFWSDRPVFVTGCTGLLGSWLTIALIESGARVVGLIRDEVPFSELLRAGYADRMSVVRGDVTDFALLERSLNEYEIDTVFHLAAQTIVTTANRAPLSTFETNVRGTWMILEAVRQSSRVRSVVVASSDKAYGDQEILPCGEDAPLLGRYPYDVSKVCADVIARSFAVTFGLPVAVTRCANLFGGGDLNWSRIVPGTIQSLLRSEPVVIRSDGKPLRDYLYVKDGVDAYLTVAEKMDDEAVRGEVFNFGLDNPLSVLDMVHAVIAASGVSGVEPEVRAEAANEIDAQYLSSRKAHKLLQWAPRFSLEESLGETVEWYRRFLQ